MGTTAQPGPARRRLAAALVPLLLAAAAAPASARRAAFRGPGPLTPSELAGAQASAAGAPARDVRLSDERTLSRWAYVLAPTHARSRPSLAAPAVHLLTTTTSDYAPELVLVLAERRGADGRPWVLARLPMRPNGRVGWVPRWKLGAFHAVRTWLVIDRGLLRARLYDRGRVVWSQRIGVGKPSTPTPAGRYYVRERLVSIDPGGMYGPFAFGTSAYSPVLTDWPGGGVVGVHGTDQPWLVPGRPSHGCIRVRNPGIRALWRLMPLGTPILIR